MRFLGFVLATLLVACLSPVPVSMAPAALAPAPSISPLAPPVGRPNVFVYPKNGQTPDQQVRDRYERYRFAAACFDAGGYSIR